MPAFVWIVLAVALAFVVVRYLGLRARQEAERKTRAEKRAKVVRDDARALHRALSGRR